MRDFVSASARACAVVGLGFAVACAAPVAQSGGWMRPEVSYGTVAVVVDEPSPVVESGLRPAELRRALASALAEAPGVRAVRSVQDPREVPEGIDTLASFEVRFEGGEVSATLVPLPTVSLRRELRYRLRLVDVETGTVLGDADRSLVLRGVEVLRAWDAEWVANDLRRLLGGSSSAREQS